MKNLLKKFIEIVLYPYDWTKDYVENFGIWTEVPPHMMYIIMILIYILGFMVFKYVWLYITCFVAGGLYVKYEETVNEFIGDFSKNESKETTSPLD